MEQILDAVSCLDPSYVRSYLEERRNWKEKDAALAEHFYKLLIEQLMAVVPISILLILVMATFFGRTVTAPMELLLGMTAAIIGLAMFIDALRVCVMPLSEQLGTELPKCLPLHWVLVIACFLGILVTYAEPAITTLRPLAKLVDPEVAPYLYCILMETQETLVFAIGLGVGAAATLGTLRFVKGWSIKPLIVVVITPTLLCAVYMWWGNKELRPLLGLAWDCGAVTTGPVTVPVLLALGIGVMKTKREQEKEQNQKEASKKAAGDYKKNKDPFNKETTQIKEAAQDALEGFGIVTLASLLPVLAVELLSIALTFIYTHEDIMAARPVEREEKSLIDKTPFRETYYSSRAILPLIGALVIIVVFVLKKPIPTITFYLKPEDVQPRKALSADRSSKSMSKLKASARRSIEYARAMAGVKKATQSGSLTVYSQTLTSAVALGAAEADGLKFHQGEFDPSRPSMSDSSSRPNSMQVEAKTNSELQGAPQEMAAIEQAFSGELQHGNRHGLPEQNGADGSIQSNGEADATKKVQLPAAAAASQVSLNPIQEVHPEVKGPGVTTSQDNILLAPGDDEEEGAGFLRKEVMHDGEFGTAPAPPAPVAVFERPRTKEEDFKNWMALLAGVAEALLGMILFSIGLTYGFTSIGDQVGTLLPAAFLEVLEEPASPYYSYGSGVFIALGTMFALGFMATRAEPALNVVGATVEKLSRGSFTQFMLVYSVCVGVGLGMLMGSTKILFGVPLIWFILFKYFVALCLTNFANEDYVNIAWDSAGVTTGPVTVPFVLSTGVGCSKAVKASEGFGILTCASVWPIMVVLVVDGLRRLIKTARDKAAANANAAIV